MQVLEKIFRSYDIRGVYPTDITEDVVLHIGKAFGTYLARRNIKDIVVGMDDRASSPSLLQSLTTGLMSTGMNVTNTGVTITPAIHYYTCARGFHAGINVTASHNPKEYNGIRFDLRGAAPFYGGALKEIYHMVLDEDYARGFGTEIKEDLLGYYLDFFKQNFHFDKHLRVVVDCGSGATSVIAPKVFEALGCDVVPVNCKYDSNFPHNIPDPENPLFMRELEQLVKEHKADVGVAFDTDGDRLGVADETGKSYETDKLLLLFAQDVLTKYKGGEIVYDIKCSEILDKEIRHMGGNPRMIQTGHTSFAEAIKNGAVLGSELSGHTYFSGDYFGYDDGVYGACRILKILDKSSLPLSKLMDVFPKMYHTDEIKINCSDEHKFVVVKDIISKFNKIKKWDNFAVNDKIDIDGIRIKISETGWFLIRASNTSPYLSIRFEGKDEAEVVQLRTSVEEVLSKYDLDLTALKTAEVIYS